MVRKAYLSAGECNVEEGENAEAGGENEVIDSSLSPNQRGEEEVKDTAAKVSVNESEVLEHCPDLKNGSQQQQSKEPSMKSTSYT